MVGTDQNGNDKLGQQNLNGKRYYVRKRIDIDLAHSNKTQQQGQIAQSKNHNTIKALEIDP